MSIRRIVELLSATLALGSCAGVEADLEAGAEATVRPSTAPGANAPASADVVVVGAGLSGLMAARTLVARGVESVVLFEARDRVGGRTLNQEIAEGVVVEAGGQWVGPTQTRILELAAELGIETFPTYLEGDAMVWFGGRAFEYDRPEAEPGPLSERLDALAGEVPLAAPWEAELAEEWDAITVRQWMDRAGLGDADRETLVSAMEMTLGGTPDEVSFLWLLFYIHSAGGFLDLERFEGGAQERRISGGSQLLSLRMFAELGPRVETYLGEPVRRIFHDASGIVVESDARSVRAQRVIVAMSPKAMTRIEFSPELPRERRALNEEWGSSGGYKAQLLYARPFWREDGHSGFSWGFGVAGLTMDNSPEDGSKGVLLCFTELELLPSTPDERRRALAEALIPAFGEAARDALGFVEKDWGSDPWSGGCVSPNPPGLLTAYGRALREPVGRIHWAGTETALVWNGYMDGALRAGERSAEEVAAALAGN